MVGILESWVEKDYRVHINIFHFKFDLKGYAINFCVKYNIDFDKMYFHGIARVLRI